MAKRTAAKSRKTRTAAGAARKRGTSTTARANAPAAVSRKTKTSRKKTYSSRVTASTASKKKISTATRKTKAKKTTIGKAGTAKNTAAKRPKSGGGDRKRGTTRETSPELSDRTTASEEAAALPQQDRAVPKTHLTLKQLREFRQLLFKKRAELAGDVTHLADEIVDRKRRGPDDQTSMPIHMADVGSDNWEREFTLGLIANEHALIREIDEALARIHNRTYGVCLATHSKISIARLRAKPWAKYCIEYARAREDGRAL